MNHTMELYSVGTRVWCLILSIAMYIIGTVGNVLIIWTVARIRHLRTVQNAIVILLALVDLLICGYLQPYSMAILIRNTEPTREFCRFQAVITAFLFPCSILFIMIIALSRYFKICQSQKYRHVFNIRNLIGATILVCVVSACFCSPLWFYDELWLFDIPLHSCVVNRYGTILYSTVFTVFVGAGLVVPAGVTSFCYVQIYRHVKKARNHLHQHWNNGLARQKLTNEEMLAKTQFSVFIVYLFMYFPFGVIAVAGQRSDYPDALHTIALYLCYMNSCINCLLYGILNKNMRKAYKDSLFCFSRKKFIKIAPTTISGHISAGRMSTDPRTIIREMRS